LVLAEQKQELDTTEKRVNEAMIGETFEKN
jgi:hypothetical protein